MRRISPRKRARNGSSRLLRAGQARFEYLTDFAIGHALLESTLSVVSHHAPPERDRDRIAQVFGDLPATREAIEDELHRKPADAAAAKGAAHEELRHAEVDRRPARQIARGHHGETHRVVATQDDQWIDRGVAEPARQLVRLAVTDLAERSHTEHAGVERREIIQIVAVGAFHPLAIAGRAARIPDTDSHALPPERQSPGR